MNFDHMPELHYEYGYQVVWVVMIVLFIGMMIYFKKKKWL
ncbi:MAG: CorA family divalent cation transporter, partial [Maribacter stanieri]